MRVVSEEFEAEILGTTSGDRLEVHAWRDGVHLCEPWHQLLPNGSQGGLPVTAWSLDWDAGRQVQGQGSFTFADADGSLAPWGMGDMLAPGGSRLQVTWVSGSSGIRVPLGWWRIRGGDPVESWRVYGASDGPRLVPGGGSVTVRADEETATIVLDELDAESVRSTTCLGEVRRLLTGICAVVADSAVTDRPVPASLVYAESRMDAVEDLLAVVRAVHRMGPDGSLQVVPVGGVGPVWTITGGEAGALIQPVRSLSDDGVYNYAISSGETADGRPLIGRAYLSGGPLAFAGPFGRVPIRHNAIAQTQAGVIADASTILANRVAGGEIDLDVTCLTHPGVQPNDRVVVVSPTTAGDAPLEGRVVGMTIRSATSDAGTTPAKAMGLTVRVSAQALEVVAARVRRG